MTHRRHIYARSFDMATVTIHAYPHSDHALPNWNFVLRWCAKCACVNLPDQETDDQHSDTSPSI